MSWKPPLREGITPAQRADDVALCCDDKLRAAHSLKELTVDWQFFTMGCIYTYGGLDCNLLAEFTTTHDDPDCTVMVVHSSRALFTGMYPMGWRDKSRRYEHELCVVPLEYWESLREWIGQASMVDRRRGRFARATVQELEIVDYLAVNHAIVAAPRPPTLPITAFGIDGTHHHIAFTSQTDGPYDAARIIRLPIREETKQLGQAILAHDPNPFRTAEMKTADPAEIARKVQEAEEKSE